MKYDGLINKPPLTEDILEHWGIRGWTKKNHKYTRRERGKNGKWRYFYGQLKSRTRKITDKIDYDHDWIIDIFDNKNSQRSELTKSLVDRRYWYKYYKKVKGPDGKWIYFYSQEAYERYVNRQEKAEKLDQDVNLDLLDVPLLSSKPSPLYAAYKTDVSTESGNCSSCAIAMDMRMRGYDVQSRPDIDGSSMDRILQSYDLGDDSYGSYMEKSGWEMDLTREGNRAYNVRDERGQLDLAQKDLESTIKDRGGNNQYGLVQMSWVDQETGEYVGGHIFNYVVKDGEVTFYESQKGEWNNETGGTVDIKTYLKDSRYIANDSGISDIHIIRTDDKELTSYAKNYVNYTPIEDANKDMSDHDYYRKPDNDDDTRFKSHSYRGKDW